MQKVRLFLVVAVLGVLVPGVAQAQTSCSNIACVAAALKADPVYVDPKAESPVNAAEAEQLRSASRRGSTPVYVAILPKAAADNNGGVDAVPAAIGKAMAANGVVAVVAGTQFRVASSATGLSSAQVKALSTDAFNANNPGKLSGKVTPMLADFIDRVQAAPRAQPASSTGASRPAAPAPAPKKKGMSGLAIFLWVLVILVAPVGLGAGVVAVRNSRRRNARKASLKSKVDSLGTALYTLENSGVALNERATAELTRAWSFYRTAEGDLDADDLEGAEAALVQSRRHMDNAERIGDSPEPAPAEPEADVVVPFKSRKKKAAAAVEVEDVKVSPSGQVIINNNNTQRRDRQEDGYGHYFPGGMMGGRMLGPGWYPMSWWDYVVLDSIMDDRRHDREHDREHDRAEAREEREPAPANASGGDWEASSGGGDWGSSDPAPAPRYDPPAPSYDPPSSGGDWGGGGGGGGDWGGGGGGGGGGGDSGGGW